MSAAPVLVLGPGPRLAALAACLRGPGGASPRVLADLAEGLGDGSWPASGATLLLLDAAAFPVEDLGLLRRLRARVPHLTVLWTARPHEAAAVAACAAPEDGFRPWPVDVTALPGLGAEDPGRAAAAPPVAAPRETLCAPGAPALDPDLQHIEAILAGFEGLRGRDAGGAPGAWRRRPRTASAPAEEPAPAAEPAAHGASDGDELDDLPLLDDLSVLDDLPLDDLPPDDLPDGDLPDGDLLEGDLLEGELELDGLAGPPPDRSRVAAEREGPRPVRREGASSGAAAGRPDGPTGRPGPQLTEPLLTREELEAFLAPDPEPAPARPVVPASPAPAPGGPAAREAHRAAPPSPPLPLPGWYRDQVADLADLVQRADLALHAASPEADLGPARVELGRLRQFARTLGCLAAPPTPRGTRVDLGILVEETLASLAQRAAAERAPRPRFLFRSEAGLEVAADKSLLVAALDAVLQTAAAACGPEDVVRTEVRRTDVGVAAVLVDLPEGRLAGLDPARVLEPYALKGRLEGVGPNALAASRGILAGHGGDLDLRRAPGRRLEFTLRLPLA